MLRLGDRWTYGVVGTLTPPGSEPLDLAGQIAVSIEPDRLLGRTDVMAIVFSQQFEITQKMVRNSLCLRPSGCSRFCRMRQAGIYRLLPTI